MSSNYMWCNLIRVARFFNRSSLFDLTVNNHFLPVINKSKLFFIHKNSLLSLSLSLSLFSLCHFIICSTCSLFPFQLSPAILSDAVILLHPI